MGRVINHFKNPVAERQRTLITKAMAFCIGRLVQVKALSTKYQKNPVFKVLNSTVGHTETGFCNGVKVWGENHLWVRYRKGFNVSGLVEPEIKNGNILRIPDRSRRGVCQKYN